MNRVLAIVVAWLGASTSVSAAEPQLLASTLGKPLLNETFNDGVIPKSFRTLESADAFRVVDGALEISYVPGQTHSTHGIFPLAGRDLVIAFDVRFVRTGTLYIGIDGYKESFRGNTHLARFSLTPERMAWDQHRGGPESKRAVGEAMKEARRLKQPIPQPTPEQLADPNYFRIEPLAARPVACAVGERHRVVLEICGNDLIAQFDGRPLVVRSTETDSQKNRLGLGLTGRGTILLDDFQVWEATRRPNWEEVRAKLNR